MNKQDLLIETIEYYQNNPRGTDSESSDGDNPFCVYYDPDTGNMCAVGRCLLDKKKAMEMTGSIDDHLAVEGSLGDRPDGFIEIDMGDFKPEYQEIDDLRFWRCLQSLHDVDYHWDVCYVTGENRLEPAGVLKVRDICKTHDIDFDEVKKHIRE